MKGSIWSSERGDGAIELTLLSVFVVVAVITGIKTMGEPYMGLVNMEYSHVQVAEQFSSGSGDGVFAFDEIGRLGLVTDARKNLIPQSLAALDTSRLTCIAAISKSETVDLGALGASGGGGPFGLPSFDIQQDTGNGPGDCVNFNGCDSGSNPSFPWQNADGESCPNLNITEARATEMFNRATQYLDLTRSTASMIKANWSYKKNLDGSNKVYDWHSTFYSGEAVPTRLRYTPGWQAWDFNPTAGGADPGCECGDTSVFGCPHVGVDDVDSDGLAMAATSAEACVNSGVGAAASVGWSGGVLIMPFGS